jgi:octaprenyl-diphosphate synthase
VSTPASRTAPLTRAEVMALVAADLIKVEKAIELDTICSVEAVTAISHHLQSSGGKRLRPVLVLLIARALGSTDDSAIRLGAVTEIVHTATLVHDDVIDEATVRRGKPSTNQRWGNQASVLAGDWLYMQAFHLTLQERQFRLLDLLIELTQTMVEGELMQSELVGRVDVSEQEYLELVHRKTACLFSVCARFGALAAGADEELENRCGDYGWNLGMAFQLTDDLLDFHATEEALGKPVANDLREGKVTLPLILALNSCSAEEREEVATVIRDGGYEGTPASNIAALLDRYGSAEAVQRRAADYIETAVEALGPFAETPYKRALISIADWIVDRQV